jgi:hypothetical protein
MGGMCSTRRHNKHTIWVNVNGRCNSPDLSVNARIIIVIQCTLET